jgi:hypothetical protein
MDGLLVFLEASRWQSGAEDDQDAPACLLPSFPAVFYLLDISVALCRSVHAYGI